MVVAKNDVAHEKLAEQLRLRKVFKSYLALVIGKLERAQGKIAAPIGRHPSRRTMMSVRPAGLGREALTLYRLAETIGDFSLLDVEIKTGRTHQIRVHLAYLGHPVVGDAVYGKGWHSKIKSQAVRSAIENLGRHFLHAAKLQFEHPRTGQRLEFSSPLPQELAELLAFLRRR
jgi:23S rRNA pseudouridine1911/1915/1917 synthase